MSIADTLRSTNIMYNSDQEVNVNDILATKNIVAARDELSTTRDLFIGASKDVTLAAESSIKLTLGSTNNFTLKDNIGSNSLLVQTGQATTLVTSGSDKRLVLAGSNVGVQKTWFTSDSNYQVLDTTEGKGFKVLNNISVKGSEAVSGFVSVGKDIACSSNLFAQSYNIFRFRDSNQAQNSATMMGYAFVVNEQDQLELVKYTQFGQTKKVTKKITVFGLNASKSNDLSDTNYLSFDQFGVTAISDSNATPIRTNETGTTSIADNSVTSIKIANGAVQSRHFADGAVSAAKFADGSVGSTKLGLASVITSKMADSNITNSQLTSGCILTNHFADSNITSAKFASGAILATHFANNSVTSAKLSATTLVGGNFADNSITSAKLGSNAIQTMHISDSNITASKLVAANILSRHLAAPITAALIADGAITTSIITDSNVTSTKLQSASVLAVHITDSNITSSKIAGSAIKNAHFDVNTITASKIASASITTEKLSTPLQQSFKQLQVSTPTGSTLDPTTFDAFLLASAVTYSLPTVTSNGKIVYLIFTGASGNTSVNVMTSSSTIQQVISLNTTSKTARLMYLGGKWLVL